MPRARMLCQEKRIWRFTNRSHRVTSRSSFQIESLTDLPQTETFGDNTQINFSESPLFLCLNTEPEDKQKDLPMKLYENSLSIVDGKPKSSFRDVQFIIQTSEIERIGVDHVANISRPGASLRMCSSQNIDLLFSSRSFVHNA